ncbi:MAG: hypothetical protein Q8Q10_01775 [bacterium]|nr:hypothetical protein [bacterium]
MKIFGQDLNLISAWDILQMLLGRSRINPPESKPHSESKQDAGLKASFMGFGKNDEALFWSAVALAKNNDWIDQTGLKNINAIFSKLNHQEKNHLYKIIGMDETDVVIEAHSKTVVKPAQAQNMRKRGAGTGSKEEDGKEMTAKSNVRGAMTISLLAGMNPNEAVKFLRNSGTLAGITDDLGYLYEKLSEFFKNTNAGKKIKAHLKKAILLYLGAKTLREAETKVSAKEQALAQRQTQSWRKRDLQKRPKLSITWIALVVFSAGAFAYVFIH